MAIELNDQAFKHAQWLIEQGEFVNDERDEWRECQPSVDDENVFIDENGFGEYGKWYLGINTKKPPETKGHYEFPYGDFERVHRSGVIAVESRAGQHDHTEIGEAAARLLSMIDEAARKQTTG